MPYPCLRGRYQVVDKLATSSAHPVVLGLDRRHNGRRCALKFSVVRSRRGFEVARREFDLLRRLHHPGIAEVVDFGTIDLSEFEGTDLLSSRAGGSFWGGRLSRGGTPERVVSSIHPLAEGLAPDGEVVYLASRFYEGLHLRDAFLWLRERAATETEVWRNFLEALAQICDALDVVHDSSLIHYDIKPENLLLIPSTDGDGCGFNAKILDFGLSDADTTPLVNGVRGTVPYIAPEILLDRPSDRRSDLFSLGVTIAYSISGRFPFAGDGAREWVASARNGELLDLAPLCPDAPPALLGLIQELCRNDPAKRPENARSVRSTIEDIGGFCVRRPPRFSARVAPQATWRPEVAAVLGELERLRQGEIETALLLVEADPDHMPELFLKEVAARARAEGFRVYTGACAARPRYAQTALAEICWKLSVDLDLTAPEYEGFGPALAAFSPAMVANASPLPRLEAAAEHTRSVDSVSDFLLSAASHDSPLVLCLRDLHLADAGTIDLLRALVRKIRLQVTSHEEGLPAHTQYDAARLIIVATLTPEDDATPRGRRVDSLGKLRGERFVGSLQLRNLEIPELSEWLRERAPRLHTSGEFLRRLYDQSDGSPRIVDEFLRCVLDNEAPSTELEATADLLFNFPRQSGEALMERYASLPKRDRQLLEILAVHGSGLPLNDIGSVLAELDEGATVESAMLAGLQRTEDNGFVEIREGVFGSVAHVRCPHFAEQLVTQLPPDFRRRVHSTLALFLKEQATTEGPCRIPIDAAFHAREAELPTLYIEQTMASGAALSRGYAFAAAAELYEELLEYLNTSEFVTAHTRGTSAGRIDEDPPLSLDAPRLRQEICSRLAEIELTRDNVPKALEHLNLLLSFSADSLTQVATASDATDSAPSEHNERRLRQAVLYRRIGEAYERAGEVGNAHHFLERSLNLLRTMALEAKTNETAATEPTVTRPAFAKPPRDASHRDRGADELTATLLAVARHRLAKEELHVAASALRECVESLEGSPLHRHELCQAYLLQSEIEQRSGNHSGRVHLLEQALELAREETDDALLSEVLAAAGAGYAARGDSDRAMQYFDERLGVAKRLRCKLELSSAYSSLGMVHHNHGDHEQALQCYQRSLYLKRELGERRGIANSYNNLGLVHQLRDNLNQAVSCFKRSIDLFSRADDQPGMATGMNNLSGVLELQGQYNEALDYAFRALAKRKQLRRQAGMASCLYRIGKIYRSRGEIEKAASYSEKGLQLRQELGERNGTAYSKAQLADIRLAQGDFVGGLNCIEEALDEFEALDNEIGVLVAQETTARILLALGELDEVKTLLESVLERSVAQGQRVLEAGALFTLGRLSLERSDLRSAERSLRNAERLFRLNQSQRELAETLLCHAELELERGEATRVNHLLEEAYAILERSGIRDLVPLYFLLRGQADVAADQPDLDSGRKSLERGLVEARELSLPGYLWRCHLRLGQLESQSGDENLARIHFQEGLALLEEGYAQLPAESRRRFFRLRERAELKRALGSGDSSGLKPSVVRQALELADSGELDRPGVEETSESIEETLGLHRQTLKLHDVAHAMGKERDLQKLLEYIMGAVLELVDAERGFLILRPGTTAGAVFSVARDNQQNTIPQPEDKVSLSVAEQVFESGRPVLAADAVDEERFTASKSIHDMRLRSLVCVPLRFRGDTLGVVYLDNRTRRHAFRQEEVNVLQAFADQAAVAVTNARLIKENTQRAAELEEAQSRTEILNVKLRRTVQARTAELAIAQEDLRQRQNQLEGRYRLDNMVGQSEAMLRIFELVQRLATTRLPVLLQGESGTGKELIARAIHFNGDRRDGPFLSENCAGLAESLLESELFGHEEGAFTGAVSSKKGLFETADGGTLFLDEVADMPTGMQQRLLRVLEVGRIRHLGGKEEIEVDVRLVSASNKDLRRCVEEGTFRQDLYYRLNGACIDVPSLRERKEDIPLLVDYFLEYLSERLGRTVPTMAPEAMRSLLDHDWPGNVRELRHFLHRTLLTSGGETIESSEIQIDGTRRGDWSPLPSAGGNGPDWDSTTLKRGRGAFEKAFIKRRLATCDGNVSLAAKTCGVSRETFYRLLRKYGVTPR